MINMTKKGFTIGDKEYVEDNGRIIEKSRLDNYNKKLSTHRKIGGILSDARAPQRLGQFDRIVDDNQED